MTLHKMKFLAQAVQKLQTYRHRKRRLPNTRLLNVYMWISDSCSLVVVLHLQTNRIPRYNILRATKEEQPNLILARVPPRHNVPYLVDRDQMGGWWNV